MEDVYADIDAVVLYYNMKENDLKHLHCLKETLIWVIA